MLIQDPIVVRLYPLFTYDPPRRLFSWLTTLQLPGYELDNAIVCSGHHRPRANSCYAKV